ncbi:C2H2-type zinc finger protein [Aquimarina sp. TRL1]|uniref:C2H2-type zinc finger protein n=1 Tax=Aquimarina sp. (strain TRL1) TaxID=2736252 RepID=UPI001589B714|nr:C2H2-type zinc finger protein [Aquimarina sp. TRL1]QKX05341.1 C2H2-type zinc finger protein [Aquimarina sp. TRL1]
MYIKGIFKDNDNLAGTIVILLLLMPQIAHTVYVFESHSRYENTWFAMAYAIGVDTAILIFTRKGWLYTAFAYFFSTLAHNLVYLYFPGSVWSGLLISVNLSATLYALTHLFLKKDKSNDQTDVSKEASKKAIAIQKVMEAGIDFQAKPFTCPQCRKTFADTKQLNGHISAHKKQNQWNPENYGDWEKKNYEAYQKYQQLWSDQ